MGRRRRQPAAIFTPYAASLQGHTDLPWRIRVETALGWNRAREAVFPAISAVQALTITCLEDPSVALRIPAPVPKTHPQRRLGHVAGHARRGARDASSLRAQLLQRREAKYREDALDSIIEIGK